MMMVLWLALFLKVFMSIRSLMLLLGRIGVTVAELLGFFLDARGKLDELAGVDEGREHHSLLEIGGGIWGHGLFFATRGL